MRNSADVERGAKDVTTRYVKNFPGKAKRWRVREFGVRDADGQIVMYDWFKRTLSVFRRTEKTVCQFVDVSNYRIGI